MSLILVFKLLISLSFGTDFRTRFSCATDHVTTSYALIESADKYELQILHHYGTEFMPIHQGLITVHDLTTLKEHADLFEQMGARQAITFAKNECSTSNDEWTCLKKEPVMLGQLESKSLKFTITNKKIVTSQYEALYKVAKISITVGSHGYTLPMEYEKDDCIFYP